MKKLAVVMAVLALSTVAGASHYHAWIKQNETKGQDGYGNDVVICTWVCTTDYRNRHMTQTQGFAYCPMPN